MDKMSKKIAELMNSVEEEMIFLYGGDFQIPDKDFTYNALLYHLALCQSFIVDEKLTPDFLEYMASLKINAKLDQDNKD